MRGRPELDQKNLDQQVPGFSRDFRIFWAGQTLSVLGSSISLVAVPLLVLQATGSVVQLGLITAITGVGTVVTGLFAGHLVDRHDRRRIMIGTDLARAGLHLLVPLAWLAGPQLWLLYLLAAGTSCLSMLFNIGYVTAVATLVRPDQVTAANGRLSSTFAIGTIAGPSLAGLLTAGVGAAWALGVDGVSFLVSASSICLIRLNRPAAVAMPAPSSSITEITESETRPDPEAGPVREEFLAGARFLWRQPTLRSLTLLLGLVLFIELGATDLLIFHLKHDLEQSGLVVGVVLGISGTGAVLAGLVTSRLRQAYGFGACWIGTTLLMGLALTGIGVSRSVPLIAVLAALLTFGTTVGGICSMSLRQQVTPDHLLGRVTSAFWALHMAPGAVGAAVLTALAARIGVPLVCGLGGLGLALIAGLALLTPVRAAHPERLVTVPAA
jgi:MFS family permease